MDTEMSGVDPARRPEIRRRVAIVREFAALRRPPKKVRQTYARRMGLSESQFLHLVQVWRISREAVCMPGARSRLATKRSRRIPAASLDVARAAIQELGPLARRKDVLEKVALLSRELDLVKPSDSTVSNMLAEARAAAGGAADMDPELLIDECTIKLPVQSNKDVVMPRVLIAVVLPERRIVAFEVSFDPEQAPALDRLMRKVEAAVSVSGVPLRVRAPHCNRTERAMIGAIPRGKGHNLPSLGRVMGSSIGDLSVVYQVSKARPSHTLIAARHATALEPDEAARIIAEAVTAHNANVPPLSASGFRLPNTAGAKLEAN